MFIEPPKICEAHGGREMISWSLGGGTGTSRVITLVEVLSTILIRHRRSQRSLIPHTRCPVLRYKSAWAGRLARASRRPTADWSERLIDCAEIKKQKQQNPPTFRHHAFFELWVRGWGEYQRWLDNAGVTCELLDNNDDKAEKYKRIGYEIQKNHMETLLQLTEWHRVAYLHGKACTIEFSKDTFIDEEGLGTMLSALEAVSETWDSNGLFKGKSRLK